MPTVRRAQAKVESERDGTRTGIPHLFCALRRAAPPRLPRRPVPPKPFGAGANQAMWNVSMPPNLVIIALLAILHFAFCILHFAFCISSTTPPPDSSKGK